MTNLRNKTEKGNTAGKKKFNNSFFSKKLTSYSGLSVGAEFCENTQFFKILPSILKVSQSNTLKFNKLNIESWKREIKNFDYFGKKFLLLRKAITICAAEQNYLKKTKKQQNHQKSYIENVGL